MYSIKDARLDASSIYRLPSTVYRLSASDAPSLIVPGPLNFLPPSKFLHSHTPTPPTPSPQPQASSPLTSAPSPKPRIPNCQPPTAKVQPPRSNRQGPIQPTKRGTRHAGLRWVLTAFCCLVLSSGSYRRGACQMRSCTNSSVSGSRRLRGVRLWRSTRVAAIAASLLSPAQKWSHPRTHACTRTHTHARTCARLSKSM
jgi:hypothetical protein